MGISLNDFFSYLYSKNEFHNDIQFINLIEDIIQTNNLVKPVDIDERLYRARRVPDEDKEKMCKGADGFWGYNAKDSQAPPNEIVEAGRFNFANNSVLYVASDKYTALSEMKSSKGEWMSIAEMRLCKSLRVIDFTNNVKNDTESILYWISFSTQLPIALQEYQFSQQLGKVIQSMGYEGIVFKSSVSVSGKNYVFFNPNVAFAINSALYQTKSVLYYAEELLPRDLTEKGDTIENDYRLLPKSITDIYSRSELEKFWQDYSARKGVR